MESSAPYRRTTYQSSPRSAYPTFIPFRETLLLHLNWAKGGLIDAFRWDFVVKLVLSDAEIRANMVKSGVLNLLSVLSICVFDLLLHVASRNDQSAEKGFFHKNIGWFYKGLWLSPLVGTSLYLNSTWCSLIARRTFLLQHGTRAIVQPQSGGYAGMLNSLATSAYRAIMVFTCVVLSMALGLLPVPLLGPLLGFLFFCWVDSYYCFEFIWIARGFSLTRRVRHIEERWAYYLAFGLPPAALCMWGNSLANAATFALVFPHYIVMATRARPLPTDPYNPAPNDGGVIRHPSPFVPLRLPIFGIVIWLNDSIVRILSVGTNKGSGLATEPTRTAERRRKNEKSLDGIENVEEGGGLADGGTDNLRKGGVPERRRVNLGSKRLD